MKKTLFKSLGPGLLYAGAAVGVSHLVQSTRAGASFGASMLWVILIANFFKFPFFEAAPRYVAATGNSLLEGYKKLGKWAVVLFFLMTITTMFIIQAAVTIVTAGLAQNVFQTDVSTNTLSCIVLAICAIILFWGKYKVLEQIMKLIIVLLSIASLLAVVLSFTQTPAEAITTNSTTFDFRNTAHIAFLIAFIGWMPAPIDISVWHSMWSLEKKKETSSVPNGFFDFHVGYWGTAVLALFFVLLGRNMLYGSGIELAPQAGKFAAQLIGIYTDALGDWSYPIIAIAALTTMFSTTLTVLDGFSRVLVPLTSNSEEATNKRKGLNYQHWLLITIAGAAVILLFFLKNMRSLVDIATTVSFLTAPVFAFLNYRVIMSKDVKEEFRFSRFKQIISWIGIFLLISTGIYFLGMKFL